MKYSIGWFTTAKGPGSRNLLSAVQQKIISGNIDARIEFIFMSRDPGESPETDLFINLAREYRIPVVHFSYKKYRQSRGISDKTNVEPLPEWRLDYDREIINILSQFHKPDICVMAGYMLVVGPELCSTFDMINLHPAAPDGPTGTWQEVIWKLIDSRSESSGVMMHLVTPELDRGPVVSYCRYPVRGPSFDEFWNKINNQTSETIVKGEGENNQLFKEIRRQGFIREMPLICLTIKAFSQGRIRVARKVVVNCEGQPIKGHDLSAEIDDEIQKQLTQ
ncbi:formyltransferase family protein [Dehalogenimonas sp. 4OHTPN]|uniref:phosphoribosylglycinamide formyltransferase 1 n=1 Tax=Dehalogenimonas sp. 4OHTPN TaxID=3166643 RepID=A0AAU8G8F6_9CHLR